MVRSRFLRKVEGAATNPGAETVKTPQDQVCGATFAAHWGTLAKEIWELWFFDMFFLCPIGSMVLLYMVTWIPSIYTLYVSIYTSTMDPMGVK